MADLWFYRLFGEEFGPVTRETLQSLLASGTLGDNDDVRPVDSQSWQTAASAIATASPSGGEDVNWYCRTAGREQGPFSFDDLLRLAENGELTAADEVRYGTDGKWRSVGSIGRLVAVLPFQESSTLRPSTVVAPENAPAARGAVTPVLQPTTDVARSKAASKPASKAPPTAPQAKAAKPRPLPDTPPQELKREPPRTEQTDAAVELPPQPAPTPAPPPQSVPAAAWSPPAKSTVSRTPPAKRSRRSSDGPGMLDSLKDPKTLVAVGAIVFVVLFLFGGSLIPASKSGDLKKLAALQELLTEFRSLRDRNASDSEWASFTEKATKQTQPMIVELKETASRRAPAKQYLLWAARDRFPEVLRDARKSPTGSEQEFEGNLYDAARLLGVAEGSPPAASGDARAAGVERGD